MKNWRPAFWVIVSVGLAQASMGSAQEAAGNSEAAAFSILRKYGSQFNKYHADFDYEFEQGQGALDYVKAIEQYRKATGQGPSGVVATASNMSMKGWVTRSRDKFRRLDIVIRDDRRDDHMTGCDGRHYYSNVYGRDYLMIDSKPLHELWSAPPPHQIFQKVFKNLEEMKDATDFETSVRSSSSSVRAAEESGSVIVSISPGLTARGESFTHHYKVDLEKSRLVGYSVTRQVFDGSKHSQLMVFVIIFEDFGKFPGGELEVPQKLVAKTYEKAPVYGDKSWKQFHINTYRIALSNMSFGDSIDDASLSIPYKKGLLVMNNMTGESHTIGEPEKGGEQ